MLSFLITAATGLVGPKWAKPLVYAALALAAVGIFFGAKAIYDHNVIANNNAKVEAKTAKADRQADTHAADQRRKDDNRLTNETEELKRSTDHAQTNHERSLARARCIRLQQSARAAGRQSPSCAGLNVPR